MNELFRRMIAKPGVTLELLIASLVANVLALALPLFVIQVLNRYVAHGVEETLATLSAGAVIAVVLEFGIRRERFRLARVVSIDADTKVAETAFAMLTSARASVLERISPARKAEIMSGIDNVRSAYSSTNICTVLDVPFALLFIGVLYLLSPALSLVVTTFVVIAFLSGILTQYSLRKPTREMIDETRAGNAYVGAAIQEAETVRAFNAADAMRTAWIAQIEKSTGQFRNIITRQGSLGLTTQSITGFMSIAVVSVGAILVVLGDLNVGALIGANILSSRSLQPISRFAQLGEAFVKARYSESLLAEFSRMPAEQTQGSVKKNYTGRLEFRDLAFAHPGSSGPLFESLSLDIPPGSLVIINGDNGSGKSTLARLLVGLIEPTRGQILVDGIDLRQINPQWWRQQVIFLPQEPGFFNSTIEANLKTLNPNMDATGLSKVVNATGLRSYLDESQQGLAAPVTEYGRHLSVGIRRRLALARALTSNGKLAIMDEPTEGLDRKGFAAVINILESLKEHGCTIIASSDNPAIVNKADFIIDLNSKPKPAVRRVARKATPIKVENA
ncbi:MAG TPA: ATP-binding cassette domain-containing protein [Rhodospirillales bacterium]|nr:ATP-binding cassette domain-containing protein [Rhodospirillales bacterium]